jgi:hypothetical protein
LDRTRRKRSGIINANRGVPLNITLGQSITQLTQRLKRAIQSWSVQL